MWEKLMALGAKTGCHQLPGRSFFIKGKQFPVCARCTGLFVGYFIMITTMGLIHISFRLSVVLCVIMFLDWLVQYLKIKQSNNIRRFITGVSCGYGLMNITIIAIQKIIKLF